MKMNTLCSLGIAPLLLMSLLIVSCAERHRSRPSQDYPPAVPPSVMETKSLGSPWENEFGLVQGAKAGDVVFLAGQVGLDEKGVMVGKGSMDMQMRQAYANVTKVLQLFNLTMDDVLEETIYVTDMSSALTVGPKVRRDVYAEHPAVAVTLVQVQRLAAADALVEIRVVAKTPMGSSRGSVSQSDGPSRRRGGRGTMSRGGMSPF